MARTGYASAAAIFVCAIAQHPCDRPQVLPAYGLQDLRNEEQNPKTKSNPNTMCLLITPGGNRGTGHFYFALTQWINAVTQKVDARTTRSENAIFKQVGRTFENSRITLPK